MKRGWMFLGLAVAAVAPTAVRACGACVEDKIAATYDHTVIDAAIARHQQVVFVAIDGPVDARRIGARVTAAAARVPGIQSGTIRTSASPPAFSFALDSRHQPGAVVARLRKALDVSGAQLTVVRIMRGSVLHQPK